MALNVFFYCQREPSLRIVRCSTGSSECSRGQTRPTHRTGPDSRASKPANGPMEVIGAYSFSVWMPRKTLSGWRCCPASPLRRARLVHLKDHSEQANRLLHWEHRSSLLSLVPPFRRRGLYPAPPLEGTFSLTRNTGYVNGYTRHERLFLRLSGLKRRARMNDLASVAARLPALVTAPKDNAHARARQARA